MPRTGLHAGAAADALVGIHTADAVVPGVDGAHGAGIAAGRILALAAGVREVGPVILGIQAVAVAAGVQVARHLHAGNVAGAAAVIGQGAVDLAALAAHAAVGVHNQQSLGERPDPHLVLRQGVGSHAQRREHRAGHGHAGKALARKLEELAARIVLVKETLFVRHEDPSLSLCNTNTCAGKK